MEPNPSITPYFCLTFPLPTGLGMDILIERRWQIVAAYLRFCSETELKDDNIEEQARMNALVMLTAQFMAEMVLRGRDVKYVWAMFAVGVQQIVHLYAEETGKDG